MEQFRKSNGSSIDTDTDSGNCGGTAPAKAGFKQAVPPPNTAPSSSHPPGRLTNNGSTNSTDRPNTSRSLPSKAATRGGGGGGSGLRLPPARQTPVRHPTRPSPLEKTEDRGHSGGAGAGRPSSGDGGGRSGTGLSCFASPPPCTSLGQTSTTVGAGVPTTSAVEASSDSHAGAFGAASESPLGSTSSVATRMRASFAGTPQHGSSIAAAAGGIDYADGADDISDGSGEDNDDGFFVPARDGSSKKRSFTHSAVGRPMPPARGFQASEKAAAYGDESGENPPENPVLATRLRRSSHGDVSREHSPENPALASRSRRSSHGDLGGGCSAGGGDEDGQPRGGSMGIVEKAAREGDGGGGGEDGGRMAAVGENRGGARGGNATRSSPARSLVGPPAARKERTTLAAAESSGLRSLSAQDPDRRPPQRTGMLHEPRRNHAKHQQAAEQRLDSGKANQNKDDADDADDDGEGDDNGVDDNYGEEETTAFLALPDAETDTRDNAAKMDQREQWMRQKDAAVTKFRRECEEEVERIKAVMEEHVGELERMLEAQLDPSLDDAIKSSIERNHREKKRARKVQHLVSAFFGDPRLSKMQRVVW